jgi:serine-type D-Ala-D-Ala carboxypeptidase
MTSDRAEPVRTLLLAAVAERAFPAAVVEVGTRQGVIWHEAFGTLDGSLEGEAARIDTVFDLASLTKVIATATLVARLWQRERLHIDDPVKRWVPGWRGEEREVATIRDLLAHSAGLTAHLPLYRDHRGRAEIESAICELPVECPPRRRAIYSDLGFMLLGFIVEDAAGAPLDEQFAAVRALVDGRVGFARGSRWTGQTAPTGVDAWRGRLLRGEVHDGNAWALDGVAGHAGLFGDAAGVGSFARLMLATLDGETDALIAPTFARAFTRRQPTAGSSRALGWDTMLPSSSCGTRMSPAAIGHTGFTGTSLWIDPLRDRYVVLLTNRVHPDGGRESIVAVRRALHDSVAEVWP